MGEGTQLFVQWQVQYINAVFYELSLVFVFCNRSSVIP